LRDSSYVIEDDDVRQEQALAALEGKRRRRASWVRADLMRSHFKRASFRGQRVNRYADAERLRDGGIASLSIGADPDLASVEFERRNLIERAIHVARSVPEPQRTRILEAFEVLTSPDGRLGAFLRLHPEAVSWTHQRIADEIGWARESVTRGLRKVK